MLHPKLTIIFTCRFNDEMVMVITKSYSSTNQTISDNIDQIPPYLVMGMNSIVFLSQILMEKGLFLYSLAWLYHD
jgi:phosphatidate phosphatase PAH1